MKRTIKVERTFSLGDFKNIKFTDEISEIAEEMAVDSSFMNTLRDLLLVGVELSFSKYIKLKTQLAEKEELRYQQLEEMRVSLLETLKAFKNGNLEN